MVLEVWVYFKNCWKFEKILFKTPVAISQTSSGVHTYGCVRGAPERDFAAFSYLYLDFASLRLCVFAVLLLLLLSVVTLTCVLGGGWRTHLDNVEVIDFKVQLEL